MKQTKIICTIGPASENVETLTKMVKAGMNVARLNFSHGSYENHELLINNLNSVAQDLGTPIAILQDLQGPKIRIKELAEPVKLKKGGVVVIGQDFDLDADVLGDLKVNDRIFIEDGTIQLEVTKAGSKVECKVINPGEVKSHKGVNLPDTDLKLEAVTDKDLEDMQFGLKYGVDFVALSFVENAKDIQKARENLAKFVGKNEPIPQIIAKIERAKAVENFDEILEEVDGIMIARGDLGVEIPDSDVPVLQKEFIDKCNAAAKPVIVATQMLDSMIDNPKPTRAEVSDVANAVIDRADGVMLSGESATGKYPVEAVIEMANIIQATESSPYEDSESESFVGRDTNDQKAALISASVKKLAQGISAKIIIGTTESGYTARYLSRERPEQPIVMLTDNPIVYRQINLLWGVQPLYVQSLSALKNIAGLLDHFIEEAKKLQMVKSGDKVVLVAGNPLGERMNLVEAINVK